MIRSIALPLAALRMPPAHADSRLRTIGPGARPVVVTDLFAAPVVRSARPSGRGHPHSASVDAGAGSASLHLPGKVDGRTHGTMLCPIQIGLDLVVCLHAGRHAEAVRV